NSILFFMIILKTLFIFPGKYHLAGPEEPIKAQVGSNVVLPCWVKPPVNVREALVEWKFNSSKTVHLFRSEGDDRESQDKSYKDRTYLNHAMLELGNVSLKLSNVTKNDEGIYSCIIIRHSKQISEKVIEKYKSGWIEKIYKVQYIGHSGHSSKPVREPAVNASNATVEWMVDSSKTVHLFRNEADERESQDDRYKDRTYLNHAMLEHGNVSLKLSNVTKNDEGIYSCLVLRLPGHNKPEDKNVTLVVGDMAPIHTLVTVTPTSTHPPPKCQSRVLLPHQ
uniref:Ig-like domain-containing protein n=1 Tax=Xiphophorus maculatus TaxID=8083 RepID=A0A3B5Q7X2_XIPMA